MATDASDPAQQRRELDEIRRQFAEVGERMDSALEPASPQDHERPRALTRPTAPPAKPPAWQRWQWVAAALSFVLGTGLGLALPRSGPSNPPPSPPSTVQSTGRTQALQIQPYPACRRSVWRQPTTATRRSPSSPASSVTEGSPRPTRPTSSPARPAVSRHPADAQNQTGQAPSGSCRGHGRRSEPPCHQRRHAA